jgi:hypothetical protein
MDLPELLDILVFRDRLEQLRKRERLERLDQPVSPALLAPLQTREQRGVMDLLDRKEQLVSKEHQDSRVRQEQLVILELRE